MELLFHYSNLEVLSGNILELTVTRLSTFGNSIGNYIGRSGSKLGKIVGRAADDESMSRVTLLS